MSIHDLAVIGSGPIGTAAARHAARSGASVVLIGPEEPADPADHDGTWAGYYDQGRLCHVLEVPLVTSVLTMRSRRRFPSLIGETGVNFLTPSHSVTVLPTDLDGAAAEWFDAEVLASNAADLGVEVDRLDAAALATDYPTVKVPAGHEALRESGAAILNPRGLVRAALADCVAQGVELVRDEVVARRRVDGVTVLTTASGSEFSARRVVVAVGAATNATGLLERPLYTPVFGASVVLAEVEGPDSVDMPTMMMLLNENGQRRFGGIVMAPVEYPDGRWYLKVSGSGLLENPLSGRDEINAWVRTGGDERDIEETRSLLADVFPHVEFKSFKVRPCLVCATVTDRPYIDFTDDVEDTVVAVEGERGAMAGDEIGRLAARLVLDGRWTDSLPHANFRAVWEEAATEEGAN